MDQEDILETFEDQMETETDISKQSTPSPDTRIEDQEESETDISTQANVEVQAVAQARVAAPIVNEAPGEITPGVVTVHGAAGSAQANVDVDAIAQAVGTRSGGWPTVNPYSTVSTFTTAPAAIDPVYRHMYDSDASTYSNQGGRVGKLFHPERPWIALLTMLQEPSLAVAYQSLPHQSLPH